MWWKKVTSPGKSCLRCGDGMLMDWGRQKVYKCNDPVMSPCEYEHPDIFFSFLFHEQKAFEIYINKVLSSSLFNSSCFCFKDGLDVFLFLLLFFLFCNLHPFYVTHWYNRWVLLSMWLFHFREKWKNPCRISILQTCWSNRRGKDGCRLQD